MREREKERKRKKINWSLIWPGVLPQNRKLFRVKKRVKPGVSVQTGRTQ
jgi:hypothetical protein